MKKIILIFLLMTTLMLAGCGSDKPNPGTPFGTGQLIGEALGDATTEDKSCASSTFEKFNLTNADEDAKDLTWLMMLTVQGKTQEFVDYIDNVSKRVLRAYIYNLECMGYK